MFQFSSLKGTFLVPKGIFYAWPASAVLLVVKTNLEFEGAKAFGVLALDDLRCPSRALHSISASFLQAY